MAKQIEEYALYKGDELLIIGTIKEIAKHEGVKVDTIKFYKTPVYKKRVESRKRSKAPKILVSLDDEDDCE